ncbi:protein Aster-C isoform X2 [Eleginops maclovinus]|uniref:protein Aster-C isoform X2 n=1 Tax=Eleginops maclovinus TaxID=56733 RepID=UPI0030810A28
MTRQLPIGMSSCRDEMHLQKDARAQHLPPHLTAWENVDAFWALFNVLSRRTTTENLGPLRVSTEEQMDQVSTRSGVGSDDITDESTSMLDVRWSSDEELSSDPQGQCLAAPQTPLPTYKQRFDEFRKLFRELPESERLIVDYTCALQRDILLQGRLYLTENWLCFYSNVFRGTKITLTLKDVINMTREKTARLIPNAIQICTATDKFFFTSFSAREKSYQGVFRMWQNTLLDKPLTSLELWQMVKLHYGNDLGLSHQEMESLHISETSMQSSLQTARPGGDEGVGRLERPHTLRLPSMENGPLEASTPPGEDFLSPLSSNNSPNMEDARSPPTQRRSPAPSLDRLAPERVSKRSSLSLDLNANQNDATEQSGSEMEERVVMPEVQGRLFINKVFHISANKMFELLFTDSSFIRRFMIARKTTNASSTAWQKDASGHMKRSLNYTITINNPLIGKSSTATENQTLYKESREGQYYLLDAEVYTHDVPYHDYFYTQNRYYIISNSKRKCRLRVYTDVKYKKQPWGLVKSFITKNSWSGIEDYFRQLEAELLEEEAEMNQGGGDTGKIGGLRRRRRTYSRTLPEHMKPNKPYGQDPQQRRDSNMGPIEINSPLRWSTTTIVIGMSLILLILTLMNLGLFFKLWAMEDVAHRMYLNTKHRLRERTEARLAPDYGPRQGPEYQSREDAQLLKTVLQDSIHLLEQLRSSLLVLHQSFAMANRTAEPQ